jgi:hypothetical protein
MELDRLVIICEFILYVEAVGIPFHIIQFFILYV